jgi:zinc transporter ZupT
MNFPGARFIAVAGFAMAIGIRTGSAGYGVAALLAGRVTSRTRAWTLAVL